MVNQKYPEHQFTEIQVVNDDALKPHRTRVLNEYGRELPRAFEVRLVINRDLAHLELDYSDVDAGGGKDLPAILATFEPELVVDGLVAKTHRFRLTRFDIEAELVHNDDKTISRPVVFRALPPVKETQE